MVKASDHLHPDPRSHALTVQLQQHSLVGACDRESVLDTLTAHVYNTYTHAYTHQNMRGSLKKKVSLGGFSARWRHLLVTHESNQLIHSNLHQREVHRMESCHAMCNIYNLCLHLATSPKAWEYTPLYSWDLQCLCTEGNTSAPGVDWPSAAQSFQSTRMTTWREAKEEHFT